MNTKNLAAAQQPDHIVDATKMVAQQQGQALDRMAIRLLVAAGFVTEDKANEALRIAHGFDKGPIAPPSAPVGVDADLFSPLNACCFRDQCRANAKSLAQQPAAVDEACESAAEDCGPVAHYDSDGVALCERCYRSLGDSP